MNVTIAIPDDLAVRLGSAAELERRALEALAIEEFRAGGVTRLELEQMLALTDGSALDDFLRAHGVVAAAASDVAADDLVAGFRAFAAGHALSGLTARGLLSDRGNFAGYPRQKQR